MNAKAMSEKGPKPERRTATRVVTAGKLPGQLSLDLETDVLQISIGGMLVEVPMPLATGSRQEFTVAIEEKELSLHGVVRSCQAFPPEGQPRAYRVGIEFVDLAPSQRERVADFVERKLGH